MGFLGCCVDVVVVVMEGDGGFGVIVKWIVLGWFDWSINVNCVVKVVVFCLIGFG